MSAFVLIDIKVENKDPYLQYITQARPIVESYGGRYLIRAGRSPPCRGLDPTKNSCNRISVPGCGRKLLWFSRLSRNSTFAGKLHRYSSHYCRRPSKTPVINLNIGVFKQAWKNVQ
jgi:hypothetical protein